MANGDMKVVTLQPSSAEYQSVKEGFKRTVTKTVTKVGHTALKYLLGKPAVYYNYSNSGLECTSASS